MTSGIFTLLSCSNVTRIGTLAIVEFAFEKLKKNQANYLSDFHLIHLLEHREFQR
jgi:hypothetical protein